MFFQLGTGEALGTEFRQAGFSKVQTTRLSSPLIYQSDADAIGAAFVGGPVALAYSRFGEPERVSAHAEYLESIAPFREGDTYRIPGEFVIVAGVKGD